jgi:pimeloyl-ACP methyl ester carboxylesterase
VRDGGPVHVTSWGEGTGDRVVLVHGSMAAGPQTWHDQQPLADDRLLIVPDRRSYGDSPDGDGDFERDAEDVAELLAEGAHLVGNSYGGVVALLAAAKRPDAVRSLTVVEPPALGLVRRLDAVEEFIARVGAARRDATDGADYARQFIASFGFAPPEREPTGRALRAARELGAKTILFAGGDGGPAAGHADVALVVPSPSTARVQEMHLFLMHVIVDQVDEWAAA